MDTIASNQQIVADAKATDTPGEEEALVSHGAASTLLRAAAIVLRLLLSLCRATRSANTTWHAMGQGATTGSLVVTLEALEKII